MKKLLSIVAFLALAITAHAQLSFVCDGKEIASGATFTTSKCDSSMSEDGSYKFVPDVCIKSTENANVTIKASSSKSFQFCYGGSCVLGRSFTRSQDLEANQPISLMLEPAGFYYDTDTVTFKYDLSAFITGKESTTKITMTLVVTNDQEVLGVNNIKATNEKVSFANGALNYNFASVAPRTITLTTVSGAEVATWNVASANGTLPLTALKPGIYVYTVSGSKARGKIVVK